MSNDSGQINRRSFLKGMAIIGTLAALPGGLLTSRCALAAPPPFLSTLKTTKYTVMLVQETVMTHAV